MASIAEIGGFGDSQLPNCTSYTHQNSPTNGTSSDEMIPTGVRPGYYVWGGLSPGHRECRCASLYWGLGTEPPMRVQGAQTPVGG